MEGQKVEVLTDILPLEFATLIGQSRCAKRYCGLVIKVLHFLQIILSIKSMRQWNNVCKFETCRIEGKTRNMV